MSLALKRAIDLAHEEARDLNNDFIGTEHLLLGLLRIGTDRNALQIGAEEVDAAPFILPSLWDLDIARRAAIQTQTQNRSENSAPPVRFLSDLWDRMTADLQQTVRRLYEDVRIHADPAAVPEVFLELLFTSGPNAAVARLRRTGIDDAALRDIFPSETGQSSDVEDFTSNQAIAKLTTARISAARIVEMAYGHARAFGWTHADTDHAMIAALEEVERRHDALAQALRDAGLTSGRLIEAPRLRPAEPPFDDTSHAGKTPLPAPSLPSPSPSPSEVIGQIERLNTKIKSMHEGARRLLGFAETSSEKMDRLVQQLAEKAPATFADLAGDAGASHGMTAQAHIVLEKAAEEAQRDGVTEVQPRHVFLALMRNGGPLMSLFFETIGLDYSLASGMLDQLEDQGILPMDDDDVLSDGDEDDV